MANFSALKTAIQNAIRQNGNEEITGDVLQQILLSVVNTMGDSAINTIEQNLSQETLARQNGDNTLQSHIDAEALARGNADTQLQNAINAIKADIDNGYVYAGIATPSSTPVSGKVFYIATAAGTYTNFGGQVLTQGINILRFNGSAWSSQQLIGIDDVPTAGSNNLVKSGGVQNELALGAVYDVSAKNPTAGPNNDGKFTLEYILDQNNVNTLIPTAYRKGGMSIKFVHTSDNKYVQYRLRHSNWTTNVDYWENLRNILNLRTNLFDEKTTNLGWLYIMRDGQVIKLNGDNFGQTAPIKVTSGEIISIYNATSNTDSFWMVRLASDDIDDVVDCRLVYPNYSIDNGSYYEYVVPPRTEYISVAYRNYMDLWIYVNLREEVKNLQNNYDVLRNEYDVLRNETVITNFFDKEAAYYGWLYIMRDGQVIKLNVDNFGQTSPISVVPGDILSIYNVTPNTDGYYIGILDSNDIEDVNAVTYIRPFKSIDGGSFYRYVVPSNVFWVSPAFIADRVDGIKIYKSIKIGDNPFVEINALGDSITQGYISSGTWADPTWCQIVANNLGCIVNNYGVSATSICDGSSESFLIRLNRMAEAWIDCLVIFGGTNDYGDRRAQTLGTINDEPAQGTNFYASFKNLVLTAIQKYPMAQILVITPMRRQNGSPNQYGISIEDIVNAEIEVARYYGVECFDFFHNGGINPAITEQRTAYTSDGLHPNQLGVNRFLAPRFTTEIQRLITNRG